MFLRMAFSQCMSLVFACLFAVFAQAQLITSGLSYNAADGVSMLWGYKSEGPASYDVFLCAGDETTGTYDTLAKVIEGGTFAPGDWLSFRVDQSVGGNYPNAYFLRIVSSSSIETWSGTTYHFTLTNMKGSFSTKVSQAIRSMQPAVALPWSPDDVEDDYLRDAPEQTPTKTTPEHGSATITTTVLVQPAESALRFPAPADAESDEQRHELRKRLYIDEHTVPWGMQTGLTKYAPMPKRAGSTIATTSPTPQYPPFPFAIATTYLGAPTVQITLSEYLTATVSGIENTAAPAPEPPLDKRMQMWLDRWKD